MTEWVAIDFETATGDRASACALGIAVVSGGEIGAGTVDQRRGSAVAPYWRNPTRARSALVIRFLKIVGS